MKKLFLLLFVFILLFTGCQSKPNSVIDLTLEEQKWLENHPVIYYASDPEFAPYEYLDENGEHRGIAADYVEKLEEILGIDIQVIPTETWTESLDMGIENQVQFLFMSKTSERLEHFDYTEAFVFAPNVFIVNKTQRNSMDLDRISDYKTGVLKSYSNKDYLLLLYPQAQTYDYDTIVDGLFDLSSGKIDVFLADLGQATYYTKKYNIQNLLFLDSLNYDFKFSFAVNKSNGILVSIFDKALDSMSQMEHDSIMEKWNSTEYESWQKRGSIQMAYTVTIVVFLIALILLLTNGLLRGLVKQKTKELYQINRELENRVQQRTADLEKSIEQLLEAQDKLIQSEKYASLGHVVSSVAHQLNTPVGNLLTSETFAFKKIEALEEQYRDNTLSKNMLTSALNELLSVHGSSIQLLNYIINILDRFKRLEATLISDYKDLLDLKTEINGGIQVLRSQNKIGDGVHLEIDVESCEIMANPLWIEEIVENLVLNSILHNKKETINIQIRGVKKEKYRLEFTDDGIGIPKDVLRNIFEPFYKSTENTQFSGLGLSIVYNIIHKNLNGEIYVESEYGLFTKIIIEIPYNSK